jgi:hypothetical protein
MLKRRTRVLSSLTAALWVVHAPFSPPRTAEARVDPLSVIKRQIHKANVLVVLDTSGSMTGIPGGTFTSATEAGVDCDNGVNCRSWDKLKCKASGRACTTDADCRKGTCSQTGTLCSNDGDCIGIPKYCTATKNTCLVDADCPTAYQCEVGGAACNPAVPCERLGLCQDSPQTTCKDELECPQWGNKGKCSATGAPCDGPCPTAKRCAVSGQPCGENTECPKNTTKGFCSNNPGKSCVKNGNCGKGNTCRFPANSCTGPENFCKHPHRPCDIESRKTNACLKVQNTCVGGVTNTCTAADKMLASDTCVRPANVTLIKMCQIAQTLCANDADCKKPGDACGPPTSRAVIAKRVLKKVLEDNYNIVNFGLMTFHQSGYFPYFVDSGGGVSKTFTEFFTRERLMAAGCYDGVSSPPFTCLVDGLLYTRRQAANSRYYAHTNESRMGYTDQDFCGDVCAVKPGYGTGVFVGAYYQILSKTGSVPGNRVAKPTYMGRNLTISGVPHTYYQSNPYYYNGGESPANAGFKFVNCATTCSAECGARWDQQLAPFLDPLADTAAARANAFAISARLEKASNGGLVFYARTPSGCTLENDGVVTAKETKSAYHYMEKVLANLATGQSLPVDQLKQCWPNYILFITDGAANGPGDSGCTNAACSAADPEAAGCKCKVVLSAWHARKNLGVRTMVVGFSGDVSAGDPAITNDNVARAGGTDAHGDGIAPFAYVATTEDELTRAIQNAIFDAAKGSYSTSQVTVSSGRQLTTGVSSGSYVLDARVDYPSWKGHLLAYDVADGTSKLAWDAAEELEKLNWWERKVYVGTAAGLVKIRVDPMAKVVMNAEELFKLGLGASAQEASQIVRWMLGDDTVPNKALLGPIVNSTPIDVGGVGNGKGTTDDKFYEKYKDRIRLTYVGSNDGMLHAFFTEDNALGDGGAEAFAYLPQSMLPKITRLFVQGGQHPDPDRHIHGLASSAKVEDICLANCTDPDTADWRTVLVMGEGFGGSDAFALDITSPFARSGVADPPIRQLWHSGLVADSKNYDAHMGFAVSVPAVAYKASTNKDDYRTIFASGYRIDKAKAGQGRSVVVAAASTGKFLESYQTSPWGSCAQEYALLADVATSRQSDSSLLGAYVGDTWGNLWRYSSNGTFGQRLSLGCQMPLHYAPTIARFDNQTYVIQVTNSSLDEETLDLPPSQLIVTRDDADTNGVLTPAKLAGVERVVRTAGADICAVSSKTACTLVLPKTARPAGTPVAVPLAAPDRGFLIFSLWYEPALRGCGKGASYVTVHELKVDDGKLNQIVGTRLASEAVLGLAFAGTNVFAATSAGLVSVGSGLGSISVQPGPPPTTTGGADRFRVSSWIELF